MVKRILFVSLLAALLAACAPAAAPQDSGAPSLAPAEKDGRALFSQYCAACHATAGDQVIVGPSLAGIAASAAERIEGMQARDYIHESIVAPGAFVNEGFQDLMPTNFGQILNEQEVDALVAYLMTLE